MKDDGPDSGASSSSPVSSQLTVDFSDLPPLPLPLHPAASGAAAFATDAQLPVHILDRESDGSQLPGRTSPARPIALDKSDSSDGDVDVENMDETSSVLEWAEDRGAVDLDSGPVDQNAMGSSPLQRRGPEASPSDRRLLASILSDLTRTTSPETPEVQPRPSSQQQEVAAAPSNQDQGSSELRPPSLSSLQEQGQDLDLLKVPPVEELKEESQESRGERGELPPLLRQASPVQLYNRNTPPPLKHKDSGSPHLRVPEEAGDMERAVNSQAELSSDPGHTHGDQVIPPISTLKRHFLASGHINRTSCHPEPAEPCPAAAPLGGVFSIHSSGHNSHNSH